MKKIALFVLLAAAGLSALASGRPSSDREYKLTEKEDIRKTLPLADPGKPLVLTVDNIFGGIEVQAADVRAVELSARKTLKARTAEKMSRAKAEVELKITQAGNDIDLYVDGPFRCKVGDCDGLKDRDSGYEVEYDFVLRVPRRTDLTAKTVTGGDILVRGLEGDFRVSNVNGKVTLDKISGSGRAHTVNGPVQAAFARVPAAACSFKTINGALNLSFPDGLAGDFSLKTMNGEAFSDFASTALPAEPASKETKDGKTLYRRGGFTRIRIGRGGPEFRCETLNGDIFLSKTKYEKENPMTKKTIRIITLTALLAAAAIAGADTAAAPERIIVPLSKPGQPAVIQAELMFGSIKISGYEGKDVIVEAKATARPVGGKNPIALAWTPAPPPAAAPSTAAPAAAPAPPAAVRVPGVAFFGQDKEKEKARKEKAAGMKQIPMDSSGLTVEENNNHVTIQVESWKSGYDLDVKVPFASGVKIEGANLGGVTVENVNGDIEIESANGGIKLAGISGAVVATTTNGDVDVVLSRLSGDKPMSFVAFHGDIDVTLPADVKANVRIKSNMGEVYSDFDIALKAAPPAAESSPKKEGGKFRVSLDRAIYGSINGGGPELKFENFSGNVYLRKKK